MKSTLVVGVIVISWAIILRLSAGGKESIVNILSFLFSLQFKDFKEFYFVTICVSVLVEIGAI